MEEKPTHFALVRIDIEDTPRIYPMDGDSIHGLNGDSDILLEHQLSPREIQAARSGQKVLEVNGSPVDLMAHIGGFATMPGVQYHEGNPLLQINLRDRLPCEKRAEGLNAVFLLCIDSDIGNRFFNELPYCVKVEFLRSGHQDPASVVKGLYKLLGEWVDEEKQKKGYEGDVPLYLIVESESTSLVDKEMSFDHTYVVTPLPGEAHMDNFRYYERGMPEYLVNNFQKRLEFLIKGLYKIEKEN